MRIRSGRHPDGFRREKSDQLRHAFEAAGKPDAVEVSDEYTSPLASDNGSNHPLALVDDDDDVVARLALPG
ncbi:hypothetical protein GCM10007937_43190 [Mesorhizobium albiziae]|nr:hypothetical protein GCM10007937_43190 [Mesorhizobium albiziae]